MLNELHDLHYHCTVPKTIPLLTDRHKECERMPFGVCCEIQKTKLEQNYFMANLKTRVEKQVSEMLVKSKMSQLRSFVECDSERMGRDRPKHTVNLVRSMPTRLNEIIEGNGNKINY